MIILICIVAKASTNVCVWSSKGTSHYTYPQERILLSYVYLYVFIDGLPKGFSFPFPQKVSKRQLTN